MKVWEETYAVGPRKPRTLTVLAMLAGAAMLLSWIWAYAVPSALLKAELIAPWPADSDPRQVWMMEGFLTLTAALILVGGVVRFLSARQLRKIDAMAEETAE